jgi:hypothetical protein
MAGEGGGNGESPVVKAITAVLGWLAGIAALAYAIGVAIFALRMRVARLPDSLGTASALPREFLITTSLVVAGIPALVVGASYYLIRRASDAVRPGSIQHWIGGTWAQKRDLLGWVVFTGGLLVIPGMLLLFPHLFGDDQQSDVISVVLIVMFVSMLFVWIAIIIRDLAARAFPTAPKFNAARAIALMAFTYALVSLPGSVLVGAAIPLTEVRVCGPELAGSHIDGSLVGITDDRTYVGEPADGSQKPRLAVISNDKIATSYVGAGSTQIACPTASSASSPR